MEQVQVRFSTRQVEYVVTDTPIMVPLNLGRYALSEIINHLLAKDKPIPFDFLIDGVLLRTSLQGYLTSKGVSAENILDLEYIPSVTPPEQLSSFQSQDWLSDVVIVKAQRPTDRLLLTTSYNGSLELWDINGESLARETISDLPLKCVAVVPSTVQGKLLVVTGGLDQCARVLEISSNDKTITTLFEAIGHTGSIEDCAISPSLSQFITASWDGNIHLYNMSLPTDGENKSTDFVTEAQSSKRQRRAGNAPRKGPKRQTIGNFTGHAGAVTAVCFPTNTEVYSGGIDHSVRMWDVENRCNTTTMSCEQAVTALSYSRRSALLASGHVDAVIRLWDLRTTDESVRLWDTRSTLRPLYVLNSNTSSNSETIAKPDVCKVFSADMSGDLVVAVGEDCKINRWMLSDAMPQVIAK